MWPHRTSASGPPTPVFSENIVVPLHTYICKIDLKPKLGPDDHSPEQNGIAKELKKKNPTHHQCTQQLGYISRV